GPHPDRGAATQSPAPRTGATCSSNLGLRPSTPRSSAPRRLPSSTCRLPCALVPRPVRGVAAHGGGEGQVFRLPLVPRTSYLETSALRPPTSGLSFCRLPLFLVPCSLFLVPCSARPSQRDVYQHFVIRQPVAQPGAAVE